MPEGSLLGWSRYGTRVEVNKGQLYGSKGLLHTLHPYRRENADTDIVEDEFRY
jgi:hypothetical protein